MGLFLAFFQSTIRSKHNTLEAQYTRGTIHSKHNTLNELRLIFTRISEIDHDVIPVNEYWVLRRIHIKTAEKNPKACVSTTSMPITVQVLSVILFYASHMSHNLFRILHESLLI
ncbi:2280bcc3-52e4-4ee8-afe0-cc0a096e0b14 [Sclerotinia trifoliorum]|uniref:2280bcc3-52e4-4ee8-afe0-cc0a096e0b14 n=1 Tax=Sclerotinia trifoliorum TaxID=28548 RepID=A0A8H2VZ21_9HELO|nr:2280bcc3-52e4-4ee8-afe0-cc0a096e0b14 [Sclerotinia trifoliorum]